MKHKSWLIACMLAIAFLLPGLSGQAQKRKKSTPEEKKYELSSKMLSTLKFRSIGPAACSGRTKP